MRWSEDSLPARGARTLRGLRDALLRALASLPFAALLLLLLGAGALVLPFHPSVCPPQGIRLLLAGLLAAGALAVLWRRRPYPPSRIGFLLAHGAPLPILAGLAGLATPWARPARLLMAAGILCLLAGCAWMFHLKPRLKARESARQGKAPAPVAPARITPGGRLLGAALLLAGGLQAPPPGGPLALEALLRMACAAATLGAAWALGGIWPGAAPLLCRLGTPPGAPLQGFLRWSRAAFLLLGAALGWAWFAGDPARLALPAPMGAWLALGALLHLQHLKGWKGSRTLWGGLAVAALLLGSLRIA